MQLIIMVVWILLAVLVLILLLHYSLNCNQKALAIRNIPGPPETFLFGNALDILLNPVQLFLIGRKWANTYKDLYRFWSIPMASINIYNPKDIETVLSNSTHNEKSILYTFIKPWLQDGLLLSGGSKWHARRKILTPAFHFNVLRHFGAVIEENSEKLAKRLEEELGQSQTNIVPIISEYTLNSICETAMGTKLDEQKSNIGKQYKKCIYSLGENLYQRFTRLHLYSNFIFKMSITGLRQNRLLKTINSFTKAVINDRRNFINEHGIVFSNDLADENDVYINKKHKLAMLDLLLSAEKDGLIDNKGIQEEVDTFMFEGHDTTAQGLTFAIMLLANHKDVQDRVVEELKQIFGNSTRSATTHDLSQMKYLECCIKESLRLYPPVHFISRTLGKTVELSNHLIPAGLVCNIHIFDLHRRSDLYPEPLQFNPDRFTPENCSGRHPYAYIPFSAGPRNCIGQRFAMMEMKSALAIILRNFELRSVTKPQDLRLLIDLVLRNQDPVYVSFFRRSTEIS